MLYAGTTSILSFKYFIFSYIVKKLKQWSKSAGNIYNLNGTSETICNETVVNTENVKPISVHVPKHLKPANDDQFGHYLAGLIDGNGYFNSKQQLVIEFNSLDASLAYYIKQRIGYGSVKKIKHKNVIIFIIAASKGIDKVIKLINGKVRTDNLNLLDNTNTIEVKLNLDNNFKNYWLAGFSDSKASFKIQVIKPSNNVEVKLNFEIIHNKNNILLLIKEFLGGEISYNNSLNTYCYNSTSLASAKNVIDYFNYFHSLSSKHVNYLKWRKSYLIIQNKQQQYLNIDELNKIIKFKNTINKFSYTTV